MRVRDGELETCVIGKWRAQRVRSIQCVSENDEFMLSRYYHS